MHLQPSLLRTLPDAIKCVVETIERHNMISPGQHLLVGVSGGSDSTALLNILVALAPHYRLKLGVAHVNHGLRPQAADDDTVFVRQMADRLDLPFHVAHCQVQTEKGSIEEQAREQRYTFFRQVMNEHGYTRLALGHQKNDNAEAVLMHLMRGSGITGLAGIPPVRDQWVVRPLIQLTRSDIQLYLADQEIEFVEDATNTDPAYERNRVRHQLLPLLAEAYNPNIVEILHRTADLCREEDTWLKQHLQPLLHETVARFEKDCLELHLPLLAPESMAVQRRLIRGALQQWHGHLRRMTIFHIDTVIGLLSKGARGKRISLPFGIEAEVGSQFLRFFRTHGRQAQTAEPDPGFKHIVPDPADLPLTLEIPQASCSLTFEIESPDSTDGLLDSDKNQARFDLDALTFPITVRSFEPGDRINPYGMQGSQKVKKLFIDRKIPSAQRQNIPLLESDGALVWIAGIRRGNQAALSSQTRRVLSVRVTWSTDPQIGFHGISDGNTPANHA